MLLERETAITQFTDAANRLPEPGGILLLSGEAGIGKTTLLEAVHDKLSASFPVLLSGCDHLFTPRPYGPLHDFADELSPTLIPLLENGAPPTQIFSAFYKALESLKRPTILVIEDAHWADHATIDLLKYISRRISFLPCLLCISYRDDEVDLTHPLSSVLRVLPSAHTTRITLPLLSEEAVNAMAKGTQYDSTHLHQVTSGNPFFVAELLASVDQGDDSVPASIRDAVAIRLMNLADTERKLLETLSLVPYAIPTELVSHLFGDQGDTLAMACVARKLLTYDTKGEFRFRHELARLATMESVSAIHQRNLHVKILQALKNLGLIENLAWLVHHAEGALDAEQVLQYAPTAARSAAGLGAHKEAASYFGKALSFVENAQPELAAQLYESWAYEVSLTTHMDSSVIEARRHAITLWRALGRQEKVGENLRHLSRLYWYQGQAAQAEQFANEAIKTYEAIPVSGERAMAYSMRSQLDMLNGRTDEAVKWGNKALELEQQFNQPEVRIHALNNIGTAFLLQGDTQGEAMLHESLALAHTHGLHEDAARVYTNYSDYCVRFKKLELGEKLISEGIAFDVSHDLESWTYYLVGIQAQLRFEQGRLIDAETIAAGVQTLDNQTLLMKLPSLLVLARVRARLADSSSDELLQQALEHAQATEELQYIMPARFGLIEAAWLKEKPNDAHVHLKWLLELDSGCLNAWQTGELLSWSMRFNHPHTPMKEIELPTPYSLELSGEFAKAADSWLELNMPYNAAMCLLMIEGDFAQQAYIEANTLFESTQAKAALGILRKRSSEQGFLGKLPRARRGPYKKASQHPAGLTAKEQEVLKHLSNGASNQEIATALSRSHRTVENHVSSILHKLNVESRIEAMLRVQSEPWLSS